MVGDQMLMEEDFIDFLEGLLKEEDLESMDQINIMIQINTRKVNLEQMAVLL